MLSTDQDRLPSVQDAFFAPGNEASVWVDGWWPCAAAAQALATRRTPTEEWWHAGTAPVLVVQGMQDRLAPPGNACALQEDLGDRVTLVEVEGAGHALLPEQPEAVATAVKSFFEAH
ncbi:MAG: alpha/beta hydrolase [Dehalococcoidia bacterium]|nr:alpha/beta hydrolase [Dehalococcoidia bacterium]